MSLYCLPGATLVPRLPRVIHILPLQGLQKKAAYRVPISRFFVHFFDNDSYFLPRVCEKFLCHHQIFLIVIIIVCLIKKPAIPKRSRPMYGLKNTNMALTSYFLERRPHHGSHIVFVF
jgi:hypothetical protein